MLSVKRHLSVILIVLLTLLAIALVLWVFDRKLQRLDAKHKTTSGTTPTRNLESFSAVYPLLKYANEKD
jgi:hypothetical protein